ncbi:4-(cytidine 5'-diphospho)-2-C-methyl-D-erythritol kinase [Frigidibacter sp. RF13]|uniref:4-(cytidine 5'-diphospho)-2-C-methyl-D-erythritol kinase n=1 Tax=Frigidibacter sp. RF13 TaxID=2997340 RepID=UPI00226F1629|nr:4-(cytidine 5'-diphospho)-2-C-methyl-D-erythritol kinase [Frigidibacter sp. RF13]MCY1127705.1 4-(cytidine 5'-diphospho)-2-C-methyl-D-erythritol kinase [Frigidibacter sp. RF13]
MAIESFAPAKINLTLHVTGRRADGYHLLDSLVVFADVGDLVRAELADDLTLEITGPMAAGLTAGPDNLVMKAARMIGVRGARLVLEKHLPLASGIGGGSSDAAATLRALARLTGQPLPEMSATVALGADVPVCLDPRPQRMRGVGERLDPVACLPRFWMVLVNPRVDVPTPAVFRTLDRRDGAPMPDPLPAFRDLASLAVFLATQRNDLAAPALRIAPVIGEVLAALSSASGCRLARMSGSGATCFGLFDSKAQADAARARIAVMEPAWWVQSAAALV